MRDSNVWRTGVLQHTVAMARMHQRDIGVWLSEVGESLAASWFNDTWTGDLDFVLYHCVPRDIACDEH